jgi:hypothetical protein
MKTYVLIVSERFPQTHKKKGQPTDFLASIHCAVQCTGNCDECGYDKEKRHTLRGNYPLWKKRMDEVQRGEAVISTRYWSGKPYRSKQHTYMDLGKYDGVGVQELRTPDNFVYADVEGKHIDWETIAKNDGLSFHDFNEWFKNPQKESMAIIHFTSFRY